MDGTLVADLHEVHGMGQHIFQSWIRECFNSWGAVLFVHDANQLTLAHVEGRLRRCKQTKRLVGDIAPGTQRRDEHPWEMIGLQELCQKVSFAFIGVHGVLRAHRAPSIASARCVRPLESQFRTVRDVLPTNLPISTSP